MKKSLSLLTLLVVLVLAGQPVGLEARTKKVPVKLREFTGRVIKV